MSELRQQQIGMVGLGVMGRNFLLNLADHGYPSVGFDLDPEKVSALEREAGERPVRGVGSAKDLVAALERPRAVMLLVPAGDPVDAVIEALTPHLDQDDLIIDGGNSHFRDGERRSEALAAEGLRFMGVGISGGEEGARRGPSIMPGGPEPAWQQVRPMLEAAAAKIDGDPCVTHLGPRSAGHYVKMVHNGIEYGLMQLLAEAYDLMHRGLGLDNDGIHEVFAGWNEGPQAGFLVEITADILLRKDDDSHGRLLDAVLDAARQKGTGKWTSQEAMDLQVPVPTIDTAVAMRGMSDLLEQRRLAESVLGPPSRKAADEGGRVVTALGDAVLAGMIITYAQGMALLRTGSEAHDYGLRLADVARIWRGGCIIRADLLEPIRRAFGDSPELSNLLLDPDLGREVKARQDGLRRTVVTAVTAGIPVPGLAASLGYFDAFTSARLPANLIQAQRDCFGAHTYERLDRDGTFHSDWRPNRNERG